PAVWPRRRPSELRDPRPDDLPSHLPQSKCRNRLAEPARLDSSLEHGPFRFDRHRSTAGAVSRSDLERLLVTGWGKSHRRWAESCNHLVVEQCCERFKILSVGGVVLQQEIACGLVTPAPLVP